MQPAILLDLDGAAHPVRRLARRDVQEGGREHHTLKGTAHGFLREVQADGGAIGFGAAAAVIVDL